MRADFDPRYVLLSRIPAPAWAITTHTRNTTIPDPVWQAIVTQLPKVDQTIEERLRRSTTDPMAIRMSRDDVTPTPAVIEAYFFGRRYFDLGDGFPDRITIETECCLLQLDNPSLPAVHHRFLVLLDWDLATCTGTRVPTYDLGRDSQLLVLQVSLVRPLTLAEVPDQDDLSDEGRAILAQRWDEFLSCVQRAAQEAVDENQDAGMFGDTFFPSRLSMTGQYTVKRVASPSTGTIDVFLRFAGQAERNEHDYLEYALSISFSGDQLQYELWGGRLL